MNRNDDFLEEYSEPIEASVSPLLSIGEMVQHPEKGIQYQVQRAVEVQGWRCPYHIYEVLEVPAPKVILPEASETPPEELAAPDHEATSCKEYKSTEPIQESGTETLAEERLTFWLWVASNPQQVTLLQKEAEIFTALKSPLFPKVHEQFTQGGRFYLVTEPLPEKNLEAALHQHEVSFSDLLLILTQVAQGLVQLHQAGWVHSGLQPTSILWGKPVKLVDLRQARRQGDEAEGPVDVGVDIFSVGALLYRFIAGKPLSEDFSLADLQCRYSGVPQILRRCLGPKDDRYPTMQLLHEDLKRLRRRYMPEITYDIFGLTTIGLEPSRTTNEDACGYLKGGTQTETKSFHWLVACVADGMGGMEAGEVASEVAVRTILKEAIETFQRNNSLLSPEEQAQKVKEWIHKANEAVCAAMQNKGAKGGTTLSCIFLIGKRLAIGHVGDSRIYLFRNGIPLLLTRDHSLAAVLALQEGRVGDLHYIRNHPDRNRLTRSLGERTPLPSYFVDSFPTEVTQKPILELEDGDVLLLCSDGVWEPVTEEEMAKIIQRHVDDLSQVAYDILNLVLQRGAPDNATVLLVRLRERQAVGIDTSAGGERDVELRPQTPSDALEGSNG